MNIKEKIMAIPNPYADISRDVSDMFVGYERGVTDSAEVAQEYVKELELAEKYNFEVIQEINAGLEQQLLAERAKMDALIAEIDTIGDCEHIDEYKHYIGEILDKWKGTK